MDNTTRRGFLAKIGAMCALPLIPLLNKKAEASPLEGMAGKLQPLKKIESASIVTNEGRHIIAYVNGTKVGTIESVTWSVSTEVLPDEEAVSLKKAPHV